MEGGKEMDSWGYVFQIMLSFAEYSDGARCFSPLPDTFIVELSADMANALLEF